MRKSPRKPRRKLSRIAVLENEVETLSLMVMSLEDLNEDLKRSINGQDHAIASLVGQQHEHKTYVNDALEFRFHQLFKEIQWTRDNISRYLPKKKKAAK